MIKELLPNTSQGVNSDRTSLHELQFSATEDLLNNANIQSLQTVRAFQLMRAASKLATEFAPRIPEGKIIPVSNEWSCNQATLPNGHTLRSSRYLAMTSDGFMVIERSQRIRTLGGPLDTHEVKGRPNIIAMVRAAKSTSVDLVRELITASTNIKLKILE